MSDDGGTGSTYTRIYINEFTEESAKDFYEKFIEAEAKDQRVIPVIIDSRGGHVQSALMMNDIIRSSNATIVTMAIGKAMSAGLFLLAAGTPGYRYCSPNCILMFHGMSAGTFGTMSDMEVDMEYYKRLQKQFLSVMAANCGHKSSYFQDLIKEKMDKDFFMTHKEANKHRIIDAIGIPSFKEEKQKTNLVIEV